MSDPLFHSWTKNGPAPTGALPKSAPRASTASWGTGQLVESVSPYRNVEEGAASVIRSVWSSTTSMPSTPYSRQAATASGSASVWPSGGLAQALNSVAPRMGRR